jgi:hypothetical protein
MTCGPPAFGGPDERGQRSKYKRLEIMWALVFRPLISFVPRAARRHSLVVAPIGFNLRASSVPPRLRVEDSASFVSSSFSNTELSISGERQNANNDEAACRHP